MIGDIPSPYTRVEGANKTVFTVSVSGDVIQTWSLTAAEPTILSSYKHPVLVKLGYRLPSAVLMMRKQSGNNFS